MTKHNRVQLIWAPSHEGRVGNETADQLSKFGSKFPFKGPESACSLSVGVANRLSGTGQIVTIKDTVNLQQDSDRHEPSARGTKELLTFKQKPVIVGGRTTCRALPPKRTLFQKRSVNPICERCLETDESVTHS
jgi:hypothetical protein